MSKVMMILLRDGLRQSSGAVAEAPYDQVVYCRVPEGWIDGEIPESKELWIKGPVLFPERLERLLETRYGATWRMGNSDGSQYVVLGMGTRLLNPQRESSRPWLSDSPDDPSMRFLHYHGEWNGQFRSVLPSEL